MKMVERWRLLSRRRRLTIYGIIGLISSVGVVFAATMLFTHTFPGVTVNQAVVQTYCTTLFAHPGSALAAVIFPGASFGIGGFPPSASGTVLFDCGQGLGTPELPALIANAGTANATFRLPACTPSPTTFVCSGYTSISIVTPPASIPSNPQSPCSGGTALTSKALITFGTAAGNVAPGTYDYCASYTVDPSGGTLPQFNLNWTQ